MSKPIHATVAQDFGAIAFQNDFSVVRCKTVIRLGQTYLMVTVHAKNSRGTEELPIGYMMGENMLQFHKP